MPAIENLIPTRYVGLHHIALFRAFFEESLNLADIAERYLETGRDLIAARRTLVMVQDALVAAGMRRDYDLEQLQLLRVPEAVIRGLRDFAALADHRSNTMPMDALTANESSEQTSVPTFNEFVDAYDPDGFFSQEEQLEHYYDHYPGALVTDRQRFGYATTQPKISAVNYLDDRSDAQTVMRTDDASARISAQSAAQRLRKLERRIRLINELEPIAASEPTLDDQVFGWFDPRIALRLSNAGLMTLGDIIDCANHNGYRWFTQVPKLGEKTALRITQWLHAHEHNLECEVMPWVLVPKAKFITDSRTIDGLVVHQRSSIADPEQSATTLQKTHDIAPLERFAVPEELDGSAGTNRYPTDRNRLQANHDYGAIYAWLNRYQHSPNTFASYRKEAERLLLWAIKQKHKPLSSLGVEDANEYVQFLFDPQPASLWVASKRYERFHPQWRPFVSKLRNQDKASTLPGQGGADLLHGQPTGSMTRDSIKLSLTIVSNMFNWLVSQLYLETNPFKALPNFKSNRQIKAHRSFSQRQWDLITEHINEVDTGSPMGNRLVFALRFCFGTGLRLNELVRIKTSDFHIGDLGAELHDVWFLNVLGKGQKDRQIPLPRSIVREVQRYLVAIDLPDDPRLSSTTLPLFPSSRDPLKPIYHTVLYRQIKEFFVSIANAIEQENASLAKHFVKASTHWLRHTHGSLAIQHGVSLPTVMESLGHASLKTTSIYARAHETKRLQEMEKFLGD